MLLGSRGKASRSHLVRFLLQRNLSPTRVLIFGFLALILFGTLLLMLPISTRDGQETDLLTALFTATSASCVTGLVVVDTYTHWTPFGQSVVLFLIQCGGLGFMSLAAIFSFLLRRTITLRERLIMTQSMNINDLSGVVRLTRHVLVGTFFCEFFGAVILAIRFSGEFGWRGGIVKGIFHSVSAFCNAGFDLMGENEAFSNLTAYVSDPIVNITIMALIIVGGLGFFVWEDIYHKRRFREFTLHTKLVLTITAVLLIGGSCMFLAFEYNNPGTLRDLPVQGKVFGAMFQATTTRTAGFNTIDQAAMTLPSKMLSMLLMFIGGSSGSTAGGIKTVTFGLLVLTAISVMRGKNEVTAFQRKINMRAILNALAEEFHFTLDVPFESYSKEIHDILIHGTNKSVKVRYKGQRGEGVYDIVFEGLIKNVERRYRETGSETIKAEYETFMRITPCSTCKGMRLKRESLAVTVADKNIYEVTNLSIRDLASFLSNLTLTTTQQLIGEQILKEIRARVQFLIDVGLDYLCLSRATGTLSGGEAQRIRLATQIGSGLVGVAYILDEPSIGLHQRDNDKLLGTLKHLRDLGNSVIVVEHDEDTMRAADYIVDIGPGAGEHGGQVVAAGTAEELMKNPASITGKYLSGELKIPVPNTRREPQGWLTVVGAKENNLKNITVNFPKGVFTCVTGVSGSGKSSLVNSILYQALAKQLNRARTIPGAYKEIKGIEQFDKVINIDQSPIGRTPRSNPATYTGVFDMIRDLFASTVDAKTRGYNKGRFSFNVKGGRCEACSGDGIVKIEMHFLPDVYVPCEVCKGKRYNRETLEVKYKGKSIYDVLNMTVEEALTFFENVPSIYRKIETLYQVGLSYIRLGQPSTTLSGGEAQRIKLATELSRKSTGKTIYILDEPTTGLHFADVHKLTEMLQKLVENGNTVIVIEHNLDVIKTADYIIDMGPEGGDGGGTVVAQGTPEEVAECPQSYTGYYVKRVIANG